MLDELVPSDKSIISFHIFPKFYIFINIPKQSTFGMQFCISALSIFVSCHNKFIKVYNLILINLQKINVNGGVSDRLLYFERL